MANKIIVIGGDFTPEPCEYCGKVEEVRPYGKNGDKICFDCGMKPENKEHTDKAFSDILDGKSEHPTEYQKN